MSHYRPPPGVTQAPRYYPPSIGPGWWPLVDALCADLLALGWSGTFHQIKEKFGALRVYIADSTPALEARIQAASAQSITVCERCGGPARTRLIRNWLHTVCETCVPVAPTEMPYTPSSDDDDF